MWRCAVLMIEDLVFPLFLMRSIAILIVLVSHSVAVFLQFGLRLSAWRRYHESRSMTYEVHVQI